jgi:hypothetical protein
MFRFTIRDVLWLMVVVGIGAGWWVDHSMYIRELNEANGKWYNLSRAIWESGFDVDPNQKWRLIPKPP